jgi:hypothetical protein
MKAAIAREAWRRVRWPARLGLLVLLAATAIAGTNAWRYLSETANPVVTDDAWYFLGAFVAPQVEGHLDWHDFFAKRGVSDHAQPVHKLWLAANVRWFALDHRLDAVVGFCGLVLCLGWFVGVGLSAVRGRPMHLHHGLALCAIPLLLFSLNSHEIFEWPLVTQYFLVLPFVLALFSVCARDRAPGPVVVFLAALGCLFALDGGGLLACIAVALVLLLRAARRGAWPPALRCGVAIALAVAAHRLFWALAMPPLPTESGDGLVESMRSVLGDPGALWKLVAIPLTTGWAHWDMLVALRGSEAAARNAVMVVGAIGLVLHGVFWWSVWRHVRDSAAAAFAAMLMLYTYGMWAGIVLGRVPEYGADYLWQLRYVAFFQLANIALVLQWMVAAGRGPEASPRRGPLLALAIVLPCVAGLAWLQHDFASRTWERAPYVRVHWKRMAEVIGCIADHPGSSMTFCPHQIPICGWSPALRDRLVATLRTRQLNVYSPVLQARYGLHPEDAPASVCQGTPAP